MNVFIDRVICRNRWLNCIQSPCSTLVLLVCEKGKDVLKVSVMGNRNINSEEELLVLFTKCWLNFYLFQYRTLVQHPYDVGHHRF